MSAEEFEFWRSFYRLYPFDDFHRYHRPAAMVGAAMGGKFKERLDFLAPQPEVDQPTPQNSKFTKADLAVINTMSALAGKK